MRARTKRAVHGRPGSSLLTQYKYGMETMQLCHCRDGFADPSFSLKSLLDSRVTVPRGSTVYHHLPTPFTGFLGRLWREGRMWMYLFLKGAVPMPRRTDDAQLDRPCAIAFAVVFGLAIIATGCGDPEIPAALEPPRAAAITIEPASVNLLSLAERATFRATVTDQYGVVFPGSVAWSGGDEGVFAVEVDGTIMAVGNGSATIVAAFEGLSATAEVLVQQVPASLSPVLANADESGAAPSADGLLLVPAEASASPVTVRVLDVGGSPVPGAEITFTPGEGHGVTDPERATTNDEGIARTDWTLGAAEGAQTLAAAYAGGPSVPVAATAATDRAVLTALYNATGGPAWTRKDNWLSAGPLADWYGVLVDTDGRVTSLALGGNNLTGTIPGQVGDLANLKILQLFGNNLTGAIPSQFGRLVNLEILFLDENDLSGRLPDELGRLGKLEWLWLNDNEDLRGALPLTLTQVPLIQFHYSGTQLCVPPDAALRAWLAGIQHHEGTGVECVQSERDILEAFYNATSGPTTWEESDNWLTDAPLGDWYGVETDASGNVTGLHLDGNFLVGRLPTEFGQLSHLETLDLAWNGLLEGPIPPEFFDLTELRDLRLNGTDFGGAAAAGHRKAHEPDAALLEQRQPDRPAPTGTRESDEPETSGHGVQLSDRPHSGRAGEADQSHGSAPLL